MRTPFKLFPDDPTKVLWFHDQPPDQKEPDMRNACLDGLDFLTLNVKVDDRGVLSTKEMTALSLMSLGAGNDLIKYATRRNQNGKGSTDALYNAFRLLGVSVSYARARTQAIRLAYKRGIFIPDPQAEQKRERLLFPLRSDLQKTRFFLLGSLIGEGLMNKEIGDILDIAPHSVENILNEIHQDLCIDTTTLVMSVGALGLFPKDEEPVSLAA